MRTGNAPRISCRKCVPAGMEYFHQLRTNRLFKIHFLWRTGPPRRQRQSSPASRSTVGVLARGPPTRPTHQCLCPRRCNAHSTTRARRHRSGGHRHRTRRGGACTRNRPRASAAWHWLAYSISLPALPGISGRLPATRPSPRARPQIAPRSRGHCGSSCVSLLRDDCRACLTVRATGRRPLRSASLSRAAAGNAAIV